MVEYAKLILSKVSFNSELFCKELNKALDKLLPYEQEELKVWLDNYTKDKPELIDCVVSINKK
ncbi:hypothetical protein CAPN008_13270 [Capnocytophaga canis]|nr:hypothetical protein CAPN008_13270 [Capnocytophaga canis]